MIGPGKYDAECTAAREATEAMAVVLIVAGGRKGSGFSVQAPVGFSLTLAGLLREVADEIDPCGADLSPKS